MQESSIFLYGKGIFTTVAVVAGVPFRYPSHWKRLRSAADRIKLNIRAFSEDSLLDELNRSVSTAGITSGRARITLADASSSPIWPGSIEGGTRLSILAAKHDPARTNIGLTHSPYPVNSRSPLAGIKSCNYLDQILSLDEARGRGFNEAIRLNERGFITSACMANVFWLSDGRLFTPSLETGCLAGTTRELVLENLECCEVEVGIETLDSADAVYLTSAGIGVARVAKYNENILKEAPHPILGLWPTRQLPTIKLSTESTSSVDSLIVGS